MRYHQFKINEYTDLETEKQTIIKTISGLDASNEEEAAILDRIYKILNSDRISSTIDNAFSKSMLTKVLVIMQKQIIRDVLEILGTLSQRLQKNEPVQTNGTRWCNQHHCIRQIVSSFESVFDNDVACTDGFPETC